MNKRIDDVEAISVNTIKSKANVETVLGLIGRMDFAEEKLNNLAKVTDDSALTLTAAMLVKDAGERGGTFVYEAEVLAALAEGNTKIKKEVQRLNEIATVGVPSVKELQKKFVEIYLEKYPETKPQVQKEFSGNWKERIYYELNKVVQIKKADENQPEKKEPEFSEEDRAWSVVKDFVAEGDIARAVSIIEKPLNEKLSQDDILVKWLTQAKIYRDFYADVSRISANALAVMKVKFLKNN
ncbi:MAG: hypothetical protein MJ210_03110, partial [Alphaproteobacteria bacterium]|nr:hypothetical protein [Alphaproteobacteria bacterium]